MKAYEIRITINGDSTTTTSTQDAKDTTKTKEQEKAEKNLAKYLTSQTIEPFIQKTKTAISQDIGLITGNSDLQNRINLGFQSVQMGVNTYKNAQAGAVIATSLGLSAGLGVGVGIGLSVINVAMDIAFNMAQLSIQERLESYQLTQVRNRQGIAYNRSRLS